MSESIQHLLDLHQAGNAAARDALIERSLDQFHQLSRRMFRKYNDLRAVAETDDVFQKALVRLHRALADIRPPTVKEFFGLAARQVRWVLHDLVREIAQAKVVTFTDRLPDVPVDSDDLQEWTEFHEQIDGLPDDDREMFDLLLYQGVTQADAANLLGISLRTVKRRWQQARLRLRQALRGEFPDGR